MDLALSMVEEDAGIDIAMRVARAMVMYVRRPRVRRFTPLSEGRFQ
jgi:transcriptional regulator GlxA family with amidase domain